jgi:hypothetical protein
MADKEKILSKPNVLDVAIAIGKDLKQIEKEIVQGRKGIQKSRRLRLAEVRKLYFVEKLTADEVAKALNTKPRNIYKDIELIKEKSKLEASEDMELKSNIINFFWEINENYKHRIKLLWEQWEKSTTPYARVAVAKEIREQEKQYVQFMQELSVVPKAAEKHLHANVTYISHLGKKPETKSKGNGEDKEGKVDLEKLREGLKNVKNEDSFSKYL